MANRSRESALQSDRTRRMAITVAGIVGAVYLFFSFFLGDMGLIQSFKIGRTRGALEKEIQELKVQNEQLRRQVESLRSDPATIEGLARDRLGLVRPGERVYLFKETPREGSTIPAPGGYPDSSK